ncbi:hypothetical protein CYMTET_48826 [Cymbomonas tetramitiformis]|uniref:Uncharacterized protein n=1 Tax=Cymbomonas tetramitiformis TaxID=36881 RepID=A0AAE0BSR1_9CHLO|nr:hypothetical protein CYMTET_48826 [Cymbomonas tetramitiformis]
MLSVKPDLYSFVINKAGLSRPPATPKLNKAVEAAKAFLAGQYYGCTAAANAFGVDNPTHVRYYVNKEVGIIIVMRPPHTTNISQGEDVINFGTFKPLFRTAKANRLLEKLNTGSKKLFLDMGDLMPCTTAAWEEDFSKEENRKAWAKIGVNPFTRCVYWELRGKEEVAKARVKKVEDVNTEVLTFGFKGLSR